MVRLAAMCYVHVEKQRHRGDKEGEEADVQRTLAVRISTAEAMEAADRDQTPV